MCHLQILSIISKNEHILNPQMKYFCKNRSKNRLFTNIIKLQSTTEMQAYVLYMWHTHEIEAES